MDTFVRQYHYVDINVAVNTERGMLLPVVRDVDSTGLLDVSKSVSTTAEAAADQSLPASEYAPGTFTVVNVGAFGVRQSENIVVTPQACLLSVGAIERKVLVDGDQWRAAPVAAMTLSCDHRVVDGAVGAQWLAEFKSLLQNPYHARSVSWKRREVSTVNVGHKRLKNFSVEKRLRPRCLYRAT